MTLLWKQDDGVDDRMMMLLTGSWMQDEDVADRVVDAG